MHIVCCMLSARGPIRPPACSRAVVRNTRSTALTRLTVVGPAKAASHGRRWAMRPGGVHTAGAETCCHVHPARSVEARDRIASARAPHTPDAQAVSCSRSPRGARRDGARSAPAQRVCDAGCTPRILCCIYICTTAMNDGPAVAALQGALSAAADACKGRRWIGDGRRSAAQLNRRRMRCGPGADVGAAGEPLADVSGSQRRCGRVAAQMWALCTE